MQRGPRGWGLGALLLSLGVGVSVLALEHYAPSILAPLERAEYDFLVRSAAPPRRVDPRLVLVLFDERSLRAAGRMPEPRSLHAALTRGLREADAGRIAWDILFERSTPEDAVLAEQMRALPTFLAVGAVAPTAHGATSAYAGGLPSRFAVGSDLPGTVWPVPEAITALLPEPSLAAAAAGGGHVMSTVDGDGILRRFPLVVSSGDRRYPSLALSVALHALGIPPEDVALERRRTLVLGARTLAEPLRVPLDEGGNLLVVPVPQWRRRLDVRSYEPFLRSVQDFPSDMRAGLSGKSVLAGADYLGSGDRVALPTEPDLPGVVVSAFVLNSLLAGEFVHPAARGATLAFTLILALATGAAFIPRRPGMLALAVLGGAAAAASPLLFRFEATYFPVALPLLAGGISAFLLTIIARARAHSRATRLAGVLARFVSPALLREIEEHGADRLPGEVARREVTVLFADVAGFTAFADVSEPEDVSAMLGRFYRVALDVVHRHGGTLDKLLGDGVLACWGMLGPLPDKERRALAAAAELHRAFPAIAGQWKARGGAELALRCGVTTSYVTAGYLGDERRATYTVVGRGVNLAARLQALAAPGTTLVDARTAAAGGEFKPSSRGSVAIKGVQGPVEVFSVDVPEASPQGP